MAGLMKKRVWEILDGGIPPEKTGSIQLEYHTRHNSRINGQDVRRIAQEYLREKERAGVVENPEPELDAVETVPKLFKNPPASKDKDKDEKDSPFVPNRLLRNIGPINAAVAKVGGPDKAMELAVVIEGAGGIKNFERAIELLKAINPQIAEIPDGTQES